MYSLYWTMSINKNSDRQTDRFSRSEIFFVWPNIFYYRSHITEPFTKHIGHLSWQTDDIWERLLKISLCCICGLISISNKTHKILGIENVTFLLNLSNVLCWFVETRHIVSKNLKIYPNSPHGLSNLWKNLECISTHCV